MSSGCTYQLQSLISLHYPQYGQLVYEVERGEDGKASCRVTLFGMQIESQERYASGEEAREAVAKVALDIVHELHRILLHRPDNDQRIQMLFKPLQEALAAQVGSVPTVAPEEMEMVRMGLPPLVQEERLKREAEDQVTPSPFNPLLTSILRKISQTAQGVAQEVAQGVAQQGGEKTVQSFAQGTVQAEVDPSIKACEEAFNPVIALHQHWQRRMTSCDQPSYDYFTKQGYFGCICRYDGHEMRAEAHYRSKNSAKLEASRLCCIAIFGEACVTFEPPPHDDAADEIKRQKEVRQKEETREREAREREARDREAREAREAVQTAQVTPVTVAPLQGTQTMEGVTEIQAAHSAIDFTLRNGRKFVSLINEYCQIARLPQPEYQYYSGKTLSSFFVCFCDNFIEGDQEKPIGVREKFVSAAFAKKTDAKEDCAARIFCHLEQHGFVDRDGRVHRENLKGLINRKRALEMAQQDRNAMVRPRSLPLANLPLPNAMPGMPVPVGFPFPPPAGFQPPAGFPFPPPPPPDPQFMAMFMPWMQSHMQQSQTVSQSITHDNTQSTAHTIAQPATPSQHSSQAQSSPSTSASLGDLVRQQRKRPSDPRTRQ